MESKETGRLEPNILAYLNMEKDYFDEYVAFNSGSKNNKSSELSDIPYSRVTPTSSSSISPLNRWKKKEFQKEEAYY